jgi:hypothetical protein
MIIPTKLKIQGFDWQVEESKDVSSEGNCFGSTHSHSQKIFIDPTTTTQKKEHTVIHEIMHAIYWQTGLGIRYKEQKILEEEIVSAISHGLYQVLKDNDLLK